MGDAGRDHLCPATGGAQLTEPGGDAVATVTDDHAALRTLPIAPVTSECYKHGLLATCDTPEG
jgi:hypothetical protein